MKRTIALDFDGVLHSYKSGWQGPTNIPDPPVPGAIEFLLQLIDEDWDIAIFSTRSTKWGGRKAMKKWLRYHAGISWLVQFDNSTEVLWQSCPVGMDPIEVEADNAGHWLARQVRWPLAKPPAFVSLDDRAIRFTGEWPGMEELNRFKPWYLR